MIKRITQFICLIVAIHIVGAVAACLCLNHFAPKKIEAAQQRLRAVGAPMTVEEALLPAVPEQQNAAPLYLEFAEFLENTPAFREAEDLIEQQIFGNNYDIYDKDWEDVYRMELSEEEWVALEAAVELLEQVGYFEWIEQIAERPYFRPDWDYEAGAAMMIPEVGNAKRMAQWCLARASLRIRANQPRLALSDLRAAYVLSEQMAQGQTLITVLTSCAIRRMAAENLEAMSRSGYDLSGLDAAVWDFTIMDYWVRALDVERLVIGRVGFETLLYGSDEEREAFWGEEFPGHSFATLGLMRWFYEYDYATYLNLMADMRAQAGLSLVELKSAEAVLEGQLIDAEPRHSTVTDLLMPSLYPVQVRLLQCEARDRLAATGLALSTYHAAHEVYPSLLADLVPQYLEKLPQDPSTGESLIYKKIEAGYALYSVGSNGLDDDGLEFDGYGNDEGDFIWAGAGSVLERISEDD